MENQLELKHILPYLPFGLPIKILNYRCDYVGIEYSTANGFYFYINDELHITYKRGFTGKDVTLFKPILKPLSDYSDINSFEMSELNYDISEQITIMDLADGNTLPEDLSYRLVCKLAEEHIDFQNLIPAGLAISYKEAGF